MITQQEYSQEEIAQRAKENSEIYHNTRTTIWCGKPIVFQDNGGFEFLEPEESYYW